MSFVYCTYIEGNPVFNNKSVLNIFKVEKNIYYESFLASLLF